MQANRAYMDHNQGDKWNQVKAIVSTISKGEQDEYIRKSKDEGFLSAWLGQQ